MPFDGFAVGGLGVGEGEDLLRSIGAFTAGLLPENRPRYLMGVGRPQDILAAVRAGFDLKVMANPESAGKLLRQGAAILMKLYGLPIPVVIAKAPR